MSKPRKEAHQEDYETLFLAFAGRVERAVLPLLLGTLVLLLLSQLLLQSSYLRSLLVTVEKLEGHPFPAVKPAVETARQKG